MIVQPRPLREDGEGEEEEEEEEEEGRGERESIAVNGVNRSSYPRRQMVRKDLKGGEGGGYFREQVSENLPKLVILVLFFLSALILVLVRNRGDAAALFCIESAAVEAETVPYPSVEFKAVKLIVGDSGKFGTVRAEKWIVVLAPAGAYPSDEIHALARIEGWQLLAVGDSDTPSEWDDVKGAIFLSVEYQATLGYRILSHLPHNSYARKSIGYLFAIHHGAKKIYDADGSARINRGDLANSFDLDLTGSDARNEPLLQYLSAPNRTCVNPYIHFGQRSIWPRGLPVEHVGHIEPDLHYGQVYSGKQFIQQGLANGLPDIDSVFYHTRKSGIEQFDIQFDLLAPPVALPQGTMAPLNSFNTLFHSPAFWALMLPISVSPKASDIFRGYWAQRILWEIGGYVVIYPPSIHRVDKMEPPSFMEEKDLHKDVGRLISFLVSWRSEKPSLFKKILHLSHSMAEAGFWTSKDVIYTADWLQDLISVGYFQPRLFTLELDRASLPLSLQLHHQEFVPLRLPSVHLGVEEASSVSSEIGSLLKWRKFYGNIVLILYCSWPVNHTTLGWKMIYGRIFKTVVILSEQSSVDFEVEVTDSSQPYIALPNIMQRYSNAEGFLFMKDEVILNYWNLLEADKNKLWNLHKVNETWKVVSYDEEGPEWYQRTSLKKRVKDLVSSLPVHFRVAYRENMGEDHFAVCDSGVFYVPQRFAGDLADLVDAGARAKLRQEVALPLFFLAMDSTDNFDGVALGEVARITDETQSPSAFYTPEAHVVFPWNVRSEVDIMSVMNAMSSGDPLLQEFL